jgi:hypothetical protein
VPPSARTVYLHIVLGLMRKALDAIVDALTAREAAGA